MKEGAIWGTCKAEIPKSQETVAENEKNSDGK